MPTTDRHPHMVTDRQTGKEWASQINNMAPYRTARAIWLGILSSVLLSAVMVVGAISPQTHRVDSHFNTAFIVFSNTTLLLSLYFFNFWVLRICIIESRKVILCFLGSLTIATLFSILSYNLEILIHGPGNTSNNFTLTLIANLAAGLIAFLISLLLSNVTQHQRILLENERLMSENIQTRYQTLQQQVKPHFLFNSLNTLDGLIGTDDAGAHRYLCQLAAIYRYAMQQQTEVTLADELEFVHSYTYLMQIRYGSAHLHVDEHIDPALLSMRMAPTSLQLLVENAVKHNIISQRHPLTITIETTPDKYIRVTNPMQPRTDSEESSGIGLDNLALRYRLLYHREIDISTSDDTFSVAIPLIKNK